MEPYDSDKMATEFLMQFNQQAFTVGQQLVFQFQELKMLSLTVKEIVGNSSYFKERRSVLILPPQGDRR
jgi:hypothetical protein